MPPRATHFRWHGIGNTQLPMDPAEGVSLDDLLVKMRRQALIIQHLGTELHAILIVLLQRKVLTLDEVRGAERRLDLAAEIARAREIAVVARDFEALDAELDAGGADAAA